MSLIKNTTFYTIGGILPKIGSFIFLPIYLRELTPSDYGIVSSLHALNAVLIVFFTLAIPRSLYRIYYDYQSNERKILHGTVFISIAVISTVMIIFVFSFNNLIQYIFRSIDFFPYFALIFIAIFFQAFYSLPQRLLQIKERAFTYVSLNLLHFIITNGLILWFVLHEKEGAVGFLKAELICLIIIIPINYLFIWKDIQFTWNKAIFKNVIFFSLPIIPGIISTWIINLSDRIFIEQYFSTVDVGIYSLGYQIAGLVLVFSNAFKKAYDPYFYRFANSDNQNDARVRLYKTNSIYITLIILITFLLAFFAEEIINILFDDRYNQAAQIIPIISLAYLFSQTTALTNLMIYQEKKPIVLMYIVIGGAIINIILNFILIPQMGMIGAALSTVISFFIIFSVEYNWAKKFYFIPFNWSIILPIFSLLLILFLIFNVVTIQDVILLFIIKLTITAIVFFAFIYKYKNTILNIIKTK